MEYKQKARRVLIIVENLPSPFDRRVWQEAQTLVANDYEVSIICPTGKGYDKRYEVIDGIHIYRHPLPLEASGPIGYFMEYSSALIWEFVLAWRVLLTRGFDVIHACNPPDTIFLIGGFFRLFGKKFLFDHHDINPELYEAKFTRKDVFHSMMLFFERLTFKTAQVSIATNESYKNIAINRGGMTEDSVFVVRSGPKLERMQKVDPVEVYKNGRKILVGYVGVMGAQEGIDQLLRCIEHIVKKVKRTDIQFCLVGGGTSLDELKEYARELDIEDFVTFTGRVSDQILLEVLNTAEICVNPDVANEMNDKSTMNKIMEYMALGKPIVQYDLTEGRVSAQNSSLYAEPNNEIDFANKILELADNPDMREYMGKAGERRVRNELEWDYEAPKLLKAYQHLFEC